MTYRELAEELLTLSPKQLEQEVMVHAISDDEEYVCNAVQVSVRVTRAPVPDIIVLEASMWFEPGSGWH